MYCFVILLLFNEMQMSVRRFSAIPHLRANHRGVSAVWSTTNFNVGRFADHKVSKHVNKTCSSARKT